MSFGYVPPKPADSIIRRFVSLVSELGARIEGFNNLLKRIQVQDVKAALRLDEDDRVLEIGAGSALGYARGLSGKVREYVATDITIDPGVRIPASLTPLICDAHILPFKDGKFTKVFMSEVIPVLARPDESMREVFRVLEDDGSLVLVNGGQYLHIQDFYRSPNRLIACVRNHGIKKGHIPSTYKEYHEKLVAFHKTNADYFVDRESYVREALDRSGFSIQSKSYSVRYYSNYCYQLLAFFRICTSGTATLTRNYILFLPLLMFLNHVSKEGKGMALITVARKSAAGALGE
jgi:SAM-dependent methyltransferase